jgi:NitT/TauT family transport system substrate-binding protein
LLQHETENHHFKPELLIARGGEMRKISVVLVVVLMVSIVLAACQPAAAPSSDAPMTKVSLRLPWIINAQAAGPFVALEKGFFADEGLEVEIQAGGPDANSITLVAAGSNTFGLHDMPSLVLAGAEGMPLISVAAFWQKHPGCIFALQESGITSLKDFEGRKIGFKEGGPWTLTKAMLNANNVDLNKIEQISVGFGIAPVLDGQVDLLTAFCTNEPLAVKREGKEVVTFVPFDYGIETSTEVLFTTQQYYDNNPEVACKMVNAIRKGWEYALANKNEAIDIVIKYGGEELEKEVQLQQLEAQEAFIVTAESTANGIGYMPSARWDDTANVLREQGILTVDLDVSKLYNQQCLSK